MKITYLLSLAVPLAVISCTTQRSSHYLHSGHKLSVAAIEDALKSHPLKPGQNIGITDLGGTATVSHHIVQVRDREALHIHRDHDLTVFMHRGHGTMQIGNEQFKIKGGDVLLIPRRVPHAFVNESAAPAVAVVVFVPAFDGKDTLPVSAAE